MLQINPILSSFRQRKFITGLLVMQVALTLAISSNTFSGISDSLSRMTRETGFAEGEIFSFVVRGSNGGFVGPQQIRRDLERINNTDGVRSVAIAAAEPFAGAATVLEFGSGDNSIKALAGVFYGDQNYLQTIGVELIEGRAFREEEVVTEAGKQPSVAIVSRALADSLYPNADALGKTMIVEGAEAEPVTIIGILRKMQFSYPAISSEIITDVEKNVVFAQQLPMYRSFIVRTDAQQRDRVMAELHPQLTAADSDRLVGPFNTLEENIGERYIEERNNIEMLSIVNIFVFAVTVLSLLGIASYNVIQRQGQIGTRRALGATQGDIVKFFLTENLLVSGGGIVLGFVLALLLNRWIVANFSAAEAGWHYLLITAAIILFIGQLSVLYPALKAARISPALATRNV